MAESEGMGEAGSEQTGAANDTPPAAAEAKELEKTAGMIVQVLDRKAATWISAIAVVFLAIFLCNTTFWMGPPARTDSLHSTGFDSPTRARLQEVEEKNDRLQAQMEKGMEVDRHRRKQIDVIFRRAQQVELCYLVDCTGSMMAHIQEVKALAQHAVDDIKRSYKQLNLSVAFVGYRDFCDGNDRLSILEFSNDLEQVKRFIDNQEAGGGGDGPEDVLGGLDAVLKLGWDAPTKVVIHVADAPCHGSRFQPAGDLDDTEHEIAKDGMDGNGLCAEELIPKILEKGISYNFYHVFPRNTQKMIAEFNKLSQAHGCGIVEVNLEETGLMRRSVAISVMNSIGDTMHALSTEIAAGEGFDASNTDGIFTVQAVPDWVTIVEQPAIVTWFQLPADISDLRFGMDLRKTSGVMKIKVAPNPFAEGRMQQAFHAYCVEGVAAKHGRLVAKRFKGSRISSFMAYEEHMEVQSVAEFLALEFTKLLQARSPGSPMVAFQRVYATQAAGIRGPYYANLEPFIEGNFEKFSSGASRASGAHEVLQAFSHWTHHATKGYLMVVHLQGVMVGKDYVLSDPVIHSTELVRHSPHIRTRFGAMNLGPRGMDAFFVGHKCNSVCKTLGLTVPESGLGAQLREAMP